MVRRAHSLERPDLTFGEDWRVVIEPSLSGRYYIVSLQRGFIRRGYDGYGWFRFTLAGAQRKGEREMRRIAAFQARVAAKNARIGAARG